MERENEYHEVENLVRESFWNVYRPGCLEHYVLHQLRNDPAFVPELDFVMTLDGQLIGQNMFMKAVIAADDGRSIPIMTMGPICIAPELKRKGYGKILLDYSLEKAKELGVTPMATWIGGELAGCDPAIMGIGPVYSTRKVMKKLGMEIGDFDLIEANEAFAAQSVAVGKDLGFDLSKLNVNGGAIALGHPVGASGCRILVTLLHEMEKADAKKGLATLCIGGGMGCATIVEMD